MKTILLILVALLAIAVAMPVVAAPTPSKGTYSVSNPSHTQVLGGRSRHASTGLSRAAERSRAVTPSQKPGGSGGKISGPGKVSK